MTNEGPQPKDTPMDIASRELQAEENEWTKIGMSLEGITVPNVEAWANSQKITAVVRVLVENDILTLDDFNLALKIQLKESMQMLREAIMEVREKQIVVPQQEKVIYDPNGKPLWFEKP